ncbi:hypothetical protein MYU51_005841 [Penicillium brevicompactum]|uniref:uncharacterized protein n=1 Tax=Penicillium brevicompactum TaxID=5074 RepID=UPI0025401899|nr:uncharacterized protein N7506_004757 [Penicillium brevicompactum]KAJ5336735.1 hypothetical protein N7506_004757 [Penicillium brevicompactum]
MHFTLTSLSLLLAGMATASSSSASSSATFTPVTSVPAMPSITLPPTSAVKSAISAVPSASWSSIAAAESSAAAQIIHSDEYDCAHQDYGCNWVASDYTYGDDYCGSSPFEAGAQLSEDHMVLAVSKDGSGDCDSKAGSQCCDVLAESPCKRGEKYLECVKP